VTPSGIDTSADPRQSVEVEAADLQEALEFERSVVDLSVQFINLPADQVPEAIRMGLGRTCGQLDLDRAILSRFDADGVAPPALCWSHAGIPAPSPGLLKDRFPWVLERIESGEVVFRSTLDDIPHAIDRASCQADGIQSLIVAPLRTNGIVLGAVAFHAVRAPRMWPLPIVQRINVIATVFAHVLARLQRDEATAAAEAEAQRLKDRLQVQNVYLRREVRERSAPTTVVGASASLRRVVEQVQQVAMTDSTVLLLGETGTGKELFATQIHELGSRRARAMVRVNCAAIPSTLIESELFGREKGAFTGALARQIGRFELAHHSTLFLDEIGDLPADVQVKLLRVLEERQIERLGSVRPITVDTRIIAATHRNLEQRMSEGAFREDLYYRLNVFPIHVPPLRERVEDIPALVWRFVDEFSKAFGKRVDSIDKDNLAALQRYGWPGNIRELRNVVERAMIVTASRHLTIAVPQASAAASRCSPRLVDVEEEHIRAVLESTGWRIRGPGGAADRLGMKPTTLETRMAKLGVKRPRQQ
jgi:formate hydrogenlyase transcriptional activator